MTGCDLCRANRPGWLYGRDMAGKKDVWTPCPRCNPGAIEAPCTTCDLCKKRAAST